MNPTIISMLALFFAACCAYYFGAYRVKEPRFCEHGIALSGWCDECDRCEECERLNPAQEPGQTHVESIGQGGETFEAGFPAAVFDTRDVRPVNAGLGREVVLAPTTSLTKPPEPGSKTGTDVHKRC